MKVAVDQLKCEGAGICVQECPQVFQFQPGSKKAAVVLDKIPKALEEKCRMLAYKCPADAIEVEESTFS